MGEAQVPSVSLGVGGCPNALTIWLPVQMLEIKLFKQAQLNFLFNVKNNKYDLSSFEKKTHFGSDIPSYYFPFSGL